MSGEAEALLAEGGALLAVRDCEAALAAFHCAEAAGADADHCAGGRWMADMLLGRYAEAWRESDDIRGRGAPDAHRFWSGEPIDGRRVMLRCLRGYGDTVMYLRWLPLLNDCARSVTVQAAPEMLPLLRAMPDARHVVTWTAHGESDRAHWDVQVESAELPYLFRATTATLPAPVPLLFAETDLHRVRMGLGPRTRPRVGMVWTSSNYDPERSLPFAQVRQMLGNHDVEFWSLQAPANNADWTHWCAEHGWGSRTFYTHGDSADSLQHAGIADMAAFLSEMDLLITTDTMAAHLSGSVGVPAWVLLREAADWRWMLDRGDSPWYPAMRLFRQSVAGEWDGPVQRVCDALRDLPETLLT